MVCLGILNPGPMEANAPWVPQSGIEVNLIPQSGTQINISNAAFISSALLFDHTKALLFSSDLILSSS